MTVAAARIVLKSPREIELMRAAGRVVRKVLDELTLAAKPGVTTAELDALAADIIRASGGTALFLGVRNPQARFPFPASICSSVNEEIVHGVPQKRVLREGDIVSIDCGVRLKGYCGDAAVTLPVGSVSAQANRLLEVTRGALELAIREIRPYQPWSSVASQVQRYCEAAGFGVVREFVGHGIGRQMHEEPKVPNFVERGRRDEDFQLVPGMTLAIEPMVTAGKPQVAFADRDQWTVVTRDGSLAAHFEHTVAVTPNGADVLTDGR